jgi:hypothetical protein
MVLSCPLMSLSVHLPPSEAVNSFERNVGSASSLGRHLTLICFLISVTINMAAVCGIHLNLYWRH